VSPEEKIAALKALIATDGWRLIIESLTSEMDKALVPAPTYGTLDEIAIAAISRSASYHALKWVRDDMIGQVITRERKAAQE
jgi:hypothetical protein